MDTRSTLTALLFGSIVILAPGAITSPVQGEDEEAEHARLVDLSFRGGTAVAFVEALREAVPEINVMVNENVELVLIEPVELKRVSPSMCLDLLDGMEYERSEYERVRLVTDYVEPVAGARPVYCVSARKVRSGPRVAPRPSASPVTQVWSVAGVLHDWERLELDLDSADILTAVQIAVDLIECDTPAVIRFHQETGLLIVRASPEQAKAIEAIIRELMMDAGRGDADGEREELQRAVTQRETALGAAREEAKQALQKVTTWQTRAELYKVEIEALHGQLERAREAMNQMMKKHADSIMQYEHRLNELREKLAEHEPMVE